MSDYKIRLGRYGENLAADFLIRRGYEIIDRNFAVSAGEIDLIAQNKNELLFVEVKTRTASDYGFPELAVDWRKIRHLMQAAQIYLTKFNLKTYWRLDIISVEINKASKTAKFRWIKDIEANY